MSAADTGEEAQTIYSAQATAYGDGRNGHVTSDDDVLDLDLAIPKEMGGPGGDLTNPEQMFAAGYSACFHGALKRVGSMAKADMTGSTVTGTVSMIRHGDRFALAVRLQVAAPQLPREQLEDLVAQASRSLSVLQRDPWQHPGRARRGR